MPRGEAEAIAVAAFRELGDCASRHRVIFCIEPNPTAYDCDFITGAGEGADLVERVDCQGFGLHLDTAAMMLAGDPIAFSCLKGAENGDGVVLRLYNPSRRPKHVRIDTTARLARCRLDETEERPLRRRTLAVRPGEIVTLRLR